MTVQAADALPLLEAELLGKCDRWTYQQNQGVIAALKKENKDLKALLAQLPASNKSGKDRLSSTSKLAQLQDSLKDLNTDSQLVFQESPGSRLVKQLQQKLSAALTKHDAAQSTCQSLEDNAQQLREHRQTHESQLGAVEEALTDMQAELDAALVSHKAVQQAKDHAKAELALVEQQLLNDRAARENQLQQHSSLVQQRQKEYEALHHGALQRLQEWKADLLHQQGPKPSPAVIGTPAIGGSGVGAAEDAADNPSSSDTQQAAGTDGLSTSASDTGLTNAEQAEATALNTHDASALSAQAPVHELQGAQDWPELSSKQAFAAIQFATGVTDVTDLVDRFLSQDDTEVTLEDLQLGRSLLHQQAEAAIKEADGQIKLNKEQYDQAGRLLVHVKAAIQSLIDKLEPLFPEIAGMTVSSDGLREAIHGCELRLVHAYEAVLVSKSGKGASQSDTRAARTDDAASRLLKTQLQTKASEDAGVQISNLQEGTISVLVLPDVA
ncbi:hypothetical protein WJX82_005993 [Trebouxia sp. C0006]